MKIRSRFLTWLVGWMAATACRLLARTLRFEGYVETPGIDPSYPMAQTAIYALWHDAILIPLARHSLTRPKAAALVSRHQDGSYLTEFMRHLGIRSIRGSTSRGGDQALRELLDQGHDWHIFITPDGPRGPQHVLKEGIVFLASRTGRPIVPIASRPAKAWYLPGRWTGLWIPRPFACCQYLLGAPIHVPPGLNREQIARERDRVQAEMDRVAARLMRIIRQGLPADEPHGVKRAA